ncbi:hypothetical protein SODALDRAFT_86257 [Sodiomyces alkalinus F11]|uniref:Uncharacterized protein n=1 Tax=Sodiomyces alkalinus (strain CBS 110278 / VKM F-3762 / F11) TaxID=1314773 RepID=A0A3N2PJI4_SODAK|nr:hypothetical protein SODALDRAFT_86257 [Sodiomyces alkalinus F11]ROT34590.1 hypothetical protein SODALDRAFT_86257 [Sodiomyces alkalinus F11]
MLPAKKEKTPPNLLTRASGEVPRLSPPTFHFGSAVTNALHHAFVSWVLVIIFRLQRLYPLFEFHSCHFASSLSIPLYARYSVSLSLCCIALRIMPKVPSYGVHPTAPRPENKHVPRVGSCAQA